MLGEESPGKESPLGFLLENPGAIRWGGGRRRRRGAEGKGVV